MPSRTCRPIGSAATALGVGVAGLVAPGGGSPAAAAGTDVVLVGHGHGHGRGLSQWGAYGYAVDAGWSSPRILAHYFGGTRAGTIGNPTITVRLTSLDGSTGPWITSSRDFTVGGKRVAAGAAARLSRKADGSWQIHTSDRGCSRPNISGPFPVSSSLVKRTSGTVADTLVVCANGRGYQGTLRVVVDGSTRTLVNALPMEEYLRGVVAKEIIAGWADSRGGLGLAALEAQAVAARSYAWSESRKPYAKTCDTTACQVYGGATLNGVRQSDPRTDRAVRATAGKVRRNAAGAVVRTEFSSSSGGYTAGGPFPAVVDRGDSRATGHTWTARLSGPALAARYRVGTFRRLRVTAQDGRGAGGGRVATVRVDGSAGSKTVRGTDFRLAWGLRSDWFFPVEQPDRQVTSLAFRRLPYSTRVYRHFGYAPKGWQDHAHVDATEYAAAGRPRVSVLPSSYTTYVKYSWSPTVYAVTSWPSEPWPQWDMLTKAQWAAAGTPTPRLTGSVYGTIYYQYSGRKAIYAQAPDGTVHRLTTAEWAAAGRPAPQVR